MGATLTHWSRVIQYAAGFESEFSMIWKLLRLFRRPLFCQVVPDLPDPEEH